MTELFATLILGVTYLDRYPTGAYINASPFHLPTYFEIVELFHSVYRCNPGAGQSVLCIRNKSHNPITVFTHFKKSSVGLA